MISKLYDAELAPLNHPVQLIHDINHLLISFMNAFTLSLFLRLKEKFWLIFRNLFNVSTGTYTQCSFYSNSNSNYYYLKKREDVYTEYGRSTSRSHIFNLQSSSFRPNTDTESRINKILNNAKMKRKKM